MNFKSSLIGIFICLPVISNLVLSPKDVNAATRIGSASRSYCDSYSGNFSRGEEFVLSLSDGQSFSVRNTGSKAKYYVSVYGSTGYIYGNKVSSDQLNFYAPQKGDYRVHVKSNNLYNSVEFCAY